MLIKKYVNIAVVLALCAFLFFLTDAQQTHLWQDRAKRAFEKKNTAYGLLYTLRAERYAGLFDRFDLVKSRVALDQKKQPGLSFFFGLAWEFLGSFALFLPHLFVQLLALFMALYVALKTQSQGLGAVFRSPALFIFLFLLLFFAGYHYRFDSARQAVLLSHVAHLSSGPGTNFAQIAQVKGPSVVFVEQESGDFMKIQAGGARGWILNKNIKKV